MKEVDIKIKELLDKPMRLNFIPQIRAYLKEMHKWTIKEARKDLEYGMSDMDTITQLEKDAILSILNPH